MEQVYIVWRIEKYTRPVLVKVFEDEFLALTCSTSLQESEEYKDITYEVKTQKVY